ncbi:septal ring lytic transglycosylase RlpA family protein [Edaphobacter bradus]|uniref:septal ring lytic transglycosylase RlpA family protein n=1 Tax=Edaphobacter bradus TaxID=2259016 RepID=UPI0021DFE70E|nr:septal ring lytic transglycosylase RlpA family protein [Edaphobacter bradus]
MKRARIVDVALVSALALTASGCHKKVKQAYQPPPPPSVYSSSDAWGRPSTRPDTSSSSSGTAQQLPSPPPDTKGKPTLVETGLASWYGPPYAGRKGADGKVYNQNAMTAAHLTLPLGSMARVTNLTTNQSAMVKITDRGPFVHGRIIDLSLAAAKATGLYRMGVAKVRVEAWAQTPRTASTPGGRWCVQIGAFAHQQDAIQLKNHLMRRYSTAKVIEFAGPTGHWVRINPQTPDRNHAQEIANNIHVPDAEPYVIRTD